MRFIIVRPEAQAWLRTAGWTYLLERLKDEVKELEQALERPRDHAAIMKEAVDVAVFDRHQEFEQFDHLREVAFIPKLHAEKRVTCDKLRVTNQNL